MPPDSAPAVREAVAFYRELLGPSLVAVCVWGSVHRGEDVPGLSDLDVWAFTGAPVAPEAHERCRAARRPRPKWLAEVLAPGRPDRPPAEIVRATLRHCAALDAGATLDPARATEARYPLLAFTLRYDATGVYGPAPAELLAGRPVPAPDALLARLFLDTPVETVRLVAGGGNHREFPVPAPTEPERRLRKLARLGVLVGAGLLMARGRFRSLRGADVLPALTAEAPSRAAFLDATARCYARVPDAGAPAPGAYLAELTTFTEWVWGEVDAAAPAG